MHLRSRGGEYLNSLHILCICTIVEHSLSIKDQNESVFSFSVHYVVWGEGYCFVLAHRQMFSILGGWEWVYVIISNGTFHSYQWYYIPDRLTEVHYTTSTFVCIDVLSFFQDFPIIFHRHHFIPFYPIFEVCQGPSIQVPDSSLLTLMAVGLKPILAKNTADRTFFQEFYEHHTHWEH